MLPIEIIYLLVLLATISVLFIVFKRPIYEAMIISYILLVVITGHSANFLGYLTKTATNTLFYAIVAFVALAQLFGGTNAISACIDFILSIFGRFKGGAGYVSLLASTFMASLSGSGAGNVAATGVFTIPAMKRTGFPSFLAANVEMACSTMGCMIPPAGSIIAAFACLEALYPGKYDMSQFWIVMWGIGIWFIIQRAITLYVFCKVYDVEPMPENEIPKFRDTLKKGWKALLIPAVIFIPFIIDSMFKKTLFTNLIGSGAGAMSSCVLLFTPGLAGLYALWISQKNFEGGFGIKKIIDMYKKNVTSIVPIAITIFFAYSISNLFGALNIGDAIGGYISSMGLNRWQLALFLPLFTALLGMVMPGSSQTVIFGGAMIAIMVAVGANPLLVAAMLPVITGAMEGMTPPLALCMYTAMGIADSNLKDTTINCLWWISVHYALSVVVMLGILPIIGL